MIRAALLAAALTAPGCTSVVWHGHDPSRSERLRVVETACGQRLDRGDVEGPTFEAIAADGLVFDADGRPIYPALTDDGWAIVRDGVPGPPWQALGPIRQTPAGDLIYAARDADGWRVIGPDGAGPAVPALAGPLRHDGRRLIYVADAPDGQRVYVDHTPGAAFDAVRQIRTADGRVAVLGRRGEADVVEVDGAVHGRFAEAADVALDATRVAVLARRGDRWHVVLDGAWSAGHQAISRVHLVAGRTLWATRDPAGDRVVVDGEASPLYARVRMAEMALGAAGATYIARQHAAERTSTGRFEPWVLVLDGAVALSAAHLGPLVRAPSRHWAIEAQRDGAAHLVRDGVWGPPWREVGLPVLSADGRHLAAIVDRGDGPGLLVVGPSGERFIPAAGALDGTVALTADGRAGCIARDGERWFFLFSDGAERPLDVDELIAALAVAPPEQRPLQLDERARLRAWVAAELARPAPPPTRPR